MTRIKELETEKKVIILMATYNGENFIREQIDSIINQSYKNWQLIIRDDNSKDITKDILIEYEKKDSRIKIISDEFGNVGQCMNFDLLMRYCVKVDGYFMFADQDDVWNFDKIELSIKKIIEVEETTEQSIPILVYTNYLVTDDKLSNSNIVYKKPFLYSNKELASRLLVQNWIMGCTMIINKSLLLMSINIPSDAENHDNWIAIVASLAGKIGFINETTMKHRIHSNNVTTKLGTTSFKARLIRVIERFKTNDKKFEKRMSLLNHVKNRIEDRIDLERLIVLDSYKKILESRGFKAVRIANKLKFYGFNLIQTILFFIQLITKKEKI